MSGYNEFVCLRLLEGDSGMSKFKKEYYTKGHIFQIDCSTYHYAAYDLNFEKERLYHLNRYYK